ncbi:MAG: mechanosensitive ion channel family protein [Pseudomonadota bacterium]
MDINKWLSYDILGNSMLTWVLATGVSVVAFTLALILRRLLLKSLDKLAQKADNAKLKVASTVVGDTSLWFLLAIALFAGSRTLTLSEEPAALVSHIVVIVLLIQLGLWAVDGIGGFLTLRRERQLSKDPGSVAALDMLHFALRVAVWTFVLLLILDNLGVNITALVAGLGVGGIAVALAAQSVLSDLFASLSIVLDKPFAIGDFLIINEFLGSVEKVGLKTTRLRSLSGEQLIFSNTDLLNSRIRNYGRMFERRVVFSIGVTYQTSSEHLREIPGIIRNAVESNDRVRFDRSHFQSYGDFALIFESVYFVLSSEYNEYMDIQQAVNLAVFETFEQKGIEFAYPTQTLYVNRTEPTNGPASGSAVSG